MNASSPVAPTLWRIEVSPARPELDAHGHAVLKDVRELGLTHVEQVASSRLFLIQADLEEATIKRIAGELLADPVTEILTFAPAVDSSQTSGDETEASAEIHLKGGVMDPVAGSTLAAIDDMDIAADGMQIATGRLYRFVGLRSREELELVARRLLSNDCIEDVYLTGFGLHDPRPATLPEAPSRPFELRQIPIRELDDDDLQKLSRDGHLFLSLEEMRTIRDYYRKQKRDPTDLELEMFAQTWSEHCVHKTLKSRIRYQGHPFPATSHARQHRIDDIRVEVVYDNLLKDTIARATRELMDDGLADWCLSVFEDNAGVVGFDEQFGVAFKVETHNHPSAIEPYGGAATGVGGCIRDIMGCGLGAKPIANTDVFCVGRPDFPMNMLPKGVLHPRRVLKGIVAGVRDYGNRMGIPTVNGAVVFDDRYLGNPLVFCGCVGLIPRNCVQKEPQPDDLIVVLGGRTGRDGIHGATFSSAELTDSHADEFSHAVQIGNAITEKQVLDAMLQARDHERGCLYTAATDCGAGGLSSAVGEMASRLGADVELEKVPLKYAGLRYDEIWISEAQERMVLSVPEANWPEIRTICEKENVEATTIGRFRNDGQLIIRYAGQVVGEIDAEFLHNGIPRTRKDATWSIPAAPIDSPRTGSSGTGLREALLDRLGRLNTTSKEWIFRQYDHEVQGGSVIKPWTGPGEGPSDAAVLRPRLDRDQGIAIGNGICPTLSDIDPYWMAVAAIDEAIRNVVCVGGNPARTAILDNFCWGNCEDPQTLGALVRACQGCYDAAIIYRTPFISGKDSLNNEFALDSSDAERIAARLELHNRRIRIPATLLVSAISLIENVSTCVTMDAKKAEQGRTAFILVGLKAEQWPEVRLEHAAELHMHVADLVRSGVVLAAHDIGDDSVLVALAEMALAGWCGMELDPETLRPSGPVTSGYILQTTDAQAAGVIGPVNSIEGLTACRIATSRDDDRLRNPELDVSLSELARAWRAGLAW